MPRYAAIFRDNSGFDWVRKQHAQEHFDYLAEHSKQIVIAGGLRESLEAFPCGGLWVMEVSDRDEAVRLIELDPYFRLGLRASYKLFTWGKAPNYGPVTL